MQYMLVICLLLMSFFSVKSRVCARDKEIIAPQGKVFMVDSTLGNNCKPDPVTFRYLKG